MVFFWGEGQVMIENCSQNIIFIIMQDISALTQKLETTIAQKNTIIASMTALVKEDEEEKRALRSTIAEYKKKYLKTTISHLQAMGFVATKGATGSSIRYLLLDVSRIGANCSFMYHRDATIVSAEAITERVLPEKLSQSLQESKSYYEHLMKDFDELRAKIETLKKQIQDLNREKELILASVKTERVGAPPHLQISEKKKKKVVDRDDLLKVSTMSKFSNISCISEKYVEEPTSHPGENSPENYLLTIFQKQKENDRNQRQQTNDTKAIKSSINGEYLDPNITHINSDRKCNLTERTTEELAINLTANSQRKCFFISGEHKWLKDSQPGQNKNKKSKLIVIRK